MRKALCYLLAAAMLLATACSFGEGIDLEGLSLEELLELNQRARDLLTEEILEKTRNDKMAMTTDNGLVMADNGEEVMVRLYQGSDTEVVIPAEYNGMPVTRIGEKAFYDNDLIVSVVLPDTMRIIGDSAFYGCGNLRSINLEYVSEVKDSAFYGAGLTGILVLKADSVVLERQAFRSRSVISWNCI